MEEPFGEVIFSYSRKQAIEDGVLIPIDRLAYNCGFSLPMVISYNLYSSLHEDEEQVEALLMRFRLLIELKIRGGRMRDRVCIEDIVLHIGGGDDGEPVLTLCHLVDL